MDPVPAATEEAGAPAEAAPTIGRTLLAMVRTRLDLLRGDLAEERDSLVAQVRLNVIASLAGLLAAFTAILALALALPPAYRAGVLGLLAVLLAAFSFWTFSLRSRNRPRFSRPFERLADQLGQDAEALFGRSRSGEDSREIP